MTLASFTLQIAVQKKKEFGIIQQNLWYVLLLPVWVELT